MSTFPKDLLREFMGKYFHPREAFICLRIKLFNQVVTQNIHRKIIIRYMKYLAYQDNKSYVESHTACPKCNLILSNQSFKKHIAKHNIVGKRMVICKPTLPCELCDVPYMKGHKCRLRIVKCETYSHLNPNGWVESLCDKQEGFDGEMRHHICAVRCRECKQICNNNNDDGEHLDICPNYSDMISKYDLTHRNRKMVPYVHRGVESSRIAFPCHYCDQDPCTCLCEKCGYPGANKIILLDRISYVCFDCAVCFKCGIKWNDASINRTWKYLQPCYCYNCSITI